MTRRTAPRQLAFVLLAVLAAALFIRLGFWQLARLEQRRAQNRVIAAHLAEPPRPVDQLLAQGGDLRYRRATATGTPDYQHEIVLAVRTHEGSPGVNLITPLRLAGSDRTVLVNRGWVYSPDGAQVDRARWREGAGETLTVSGYLDSLASGGPPAFRMSADGRTVRRLLRDSMPGLLPYPVDGVYLVATTPSASPVDSAPARLPALALDEGPHLGYALQWFMFATIAVVGAGVVFARGSRQ